MEAEARREQILDQAERVFASRGFERTSIGDICAAAGIARGTLYQYFDNKQSVFREVLQRYVDRIKQLMQPFFEQGVPRPQSREELVRFMAERLRLIYETVARDRHIYTILLREAMARHAGTEDLAKTVVDQFIGLMLLELRDAVDRGLLRCRDLRLVAEFLLGGIFGVAIARILEASPPTDVDGIAWQTAELIVRVLEGGTS